MSLKDWLRKLLARFRKISMQPDERSLRRGTLLHLGSVSGGDDILRVVMGPKGFDVTGAVSMPDALRLIEQRQPVAVLIEKATREHFYGLIQIDFLGQLVNRPDFYRYYQLRPEPPRPFTKSHFWFDRVPDQGPDAHPPVIPDVPRNSGRASQVNAKPAEMTMQYHKSVLCVAKDQELIRSVKETLRSLGFDVQVVHNPDEARVFLKMFAPRIVLLEASIPDNYRLATSQDFAGRYRKRTVISYLSPGTNSEIVWFDRASGSGREFAQVPEPLRPRGPSPLVAHAGVPVPEGPTSLDLRGKPLPDDDAD